MDRKERDDGAYSRRSEERGVSRKRHEGAKKRDTTIEKRNGKEIVRESEGVKRMAGLRRRGWGGVKDSPHKHLECDTLVSGTHIKELGHQGV